MKIINDNSCVAIRMCVCRYDRAPGKFVRGRKLVQIFCVIYNTITNMYLMSNSLFASRSHQELLAPKSLKEREEVNLSKTAIDAQLEIISIRRSIPRLLFMFICWEDSQMLSIPHTHALREPKTLAKQTSDSDQWPNAGQTWWIFTLKRSRNTRESSLIWKMVFRFWP